MTAYLTLAGFSFIIFEMVLAVSGAIGESWPKVVTRATFVCGLGFVWTWLFWFVPARTMPGIKEIIRVLDDAFALIPLSGDFAWAFRSFALVLVALLPLLFLTRSPRALGFGGAVRGGWRLLGLPFVVAVPAAVWLGMQPGMGTFYAYIFESRWQLLLANAVVIVLEHAWIQGALLGLALPGGRFAETSNPPREGILSRVGFGFPIPETSGTERTACERTLFSWLGVPPKVIPCLALQAIVFGAVHMSKNWGELVTAFPGGFGLGIITYRTRSFWPSVALHIGTAGVVLLTIRLSE